MFMLKYFRGYHRPTKINRYEYLTCNDFHMKISQFMVFTTEAIHQRNKVLKL